MIEINTNQVTEEAIRFQSNHVHYVFQVARRRFKDIES